MSQPARLPPRWESRCDDASGVVEVRRRDRGTLRKAVLTDDGYLIAEGIAAIAGIHEYRVRDADGSIRVIRELVDDEVLERTAGRLARMPMTKRHPAGLVTDENWGELGVGDVDGEVDFVRSERGGFVRVRVCTRRKDAVDAVRGQNGETPLPELSCGYRAKVDPNPGTHPIYGDYDQKQIDRVYNHLAHVERARHGPDARLRLDGDDLDLDALLPADVGVGGALTLPRFDGADPTPIHEDSMDHWIALAAKFGVVRTDAMSDEQFKQAIIAAAAVAQQKADAADAYKRDAEEEKKKAGGLSKFMAMAKKRMKDREGYAEDMSAEQLADMMGKAYDQATAKKDAAEEALAQIKAETQAKADTAEAAKLVALAKHHGHEVKRQTVKVDGADQPEPVADLRKRVLEAVTAKKFDGKSDEYVIARIDGLIEDANLPAERSDDDPLWTPRDDGSDPKPPPLSGPSSAPLPFKVDGWQASLNQQERDAS